MDLKTNILFYFLLRSQKPDLICDVGSCNGRNAIRFRLFSPRSEIIAFEANPYNARNMIADPAIEKSRVIVERKAVSNKEGEVVFRVSQVNAEKCRVGISSLRRRIDGNDEGEDVRVLSVRLDQYIDSMDVTFKSVALWIDVEGMGYEVLEGIEKIKDRVSVIHIEVETKAFWIGQKLKPDVERLLRRLGFQFVGRGMPEIQHDLVYVNKTLLDRSPIMFRMITALALICSFFLALRDRIKSRSGV